jgi:hypothetical protein
MKTLLIVLLAATSFSSAYADTQTAQTTVSCRNTSRLPSGLSLTITSDNVAHFTNRDNIGPFVNLGTLPVSAQSRGEQVEYTGSDFSLQITRSYDQVDNGYMAQVYLDIQGRVFNEPMYCNYPSQM